MSQIPHPKPHSHRLELKVPKNAKDDGPLDIEALINEITHEVMDELEATAPRPERPKSEFLRKPTSEIQRRSKPVAPPSESEIEQGLAKLTWSTGEEPPASTPRRGIGRGWIGAGLIAVASAAITAVQFIPTAVASNDYQIELRTVRVESPGRSDSEDLVVPFAYDELLPGRNRVEVHANATRAVHVYILDEHPITHRLRRVFPQAYLQTKNPLAPGVSHELPGLDRTGTPFGLTGDENGGAVNWIVITSAEELPWIETLTRDEGSLPELRRRIVELHPGTRPDVDEPRSLTEWTDRIPAGPISSTDTTTLHHFRYETPPPPERPKK
ncbi:MAG: hypothetical protein KDC38_00525 [Planctomycetes bacterium]|nr:hypothetical protein [Planctomycetota bacterium]